MAERQFALDLHFNFDAIVPEATRAEFVRAINGEVDEVPMYATEPGVFVVWRAIIPGHCYITTSRLSQKHIDDIVKAVMTPRCTRLTTHYGLTRQVRMSYLVCQNILPMQI